jgi:transcriptional regulator with XRE-family HTH domain
MAKERTTEARGPEYLEFGANLTKLRKARGLSQSETAAALGITQSTYAGWETGTRKVQLSTMLQLSEYFGVSVDVLIGVQKLTVPTTDERAFDLKESEKNLILTFRKLNREGKQKLCERADELLDLGYVQKGDAAKMA